MYTTNSSNDRLVFNTYKDLNRNDIIHLDIVPKRVITTMPTAALNDRLYTPNALATEYNTIADPKNTAIPAILYRMPEIIWFGISLFILCLFRVYSYKSKIPCI